MHIHLFLQEIVYVRALIDGHLLGDVCNTGGLGHDVQDYYDSYACLHFLIFFVLKPPDSI